MTRDPSSIPKRRRKAAGITTVPRFPTLLVLWGIEASYSFD